MTVRRIAVGLIVTVTSPAVARAAAAQTPRDVVVRAISAMGGEAALRGVGGVAWDYYIATFGIGQSELPESPPRATVATGHAVHDYRAGRRSTVQENRLLTGAVQRQRLIVTSTMGMNEINGQQSPAAPGTVAAQLRLLRIAPERLMLAALDDPSLAAVPARAFRDAMCDGVRIAAADTATVWFDRVTGLPLVIEFVTDDPILGDRATQWWLTRWQPAGAILVPRQWDQIVNGRPAQQLYITAATIDPAMPDSAFAIPDSIARRALPPGTLPPPLTVTLVQLAPFVWRAEGGTHFSLIVEQPGQLVVVDAPLSTERSRAVLDTLRARFPGKRVGLVVATHHHWDHAGGMREYIAEGIPVATLEANTAFIRQVAAARRSVRPDLQAQRRRTPTLRTFTDSLVIGTGESSVVLYRQPTTHVEGLLSAWVPGAGVLFTADVLSPGAQLAPVGSAEMVALARARGLRPDRYAGAHGTLASWADVERAAVR